MAVPCQISPQKDAHAGFQFFFHNVLLHIFLAPNITKLETYFAFLYIPGLSHSVLVKEKKMASLRNIVPTIYIGQAKSQPHKNQSSNNLIMYSKLSVLFFSLDQKPNPKQQMSAKVFDVVSFLKEERPMKKTNSDDIWCFVFVFQSQTDPMKRAFIMQLQFVMQLQVLSGT